MAKRRGRKRAGVSESDLSKGDLRKLNALRKSLGHEIAERAFAEWQENQGANGAGTADRNANTIVEALQPLITASCAFRGVATSSAAGVAE